MKKYLVAAFLFLVMFGLTTQPTYAFSGVSGTIIDSKTFQPWTFGAEIFVVNVSTGNLIATGVVAGGPAADGTFSVNYGDDALSECANYGGCVNPTNFQQIKVIVDYNCALSTANGTRPNPSTSTDSNCPSDNSRTPMVGIPVPNEVQFTELNGAIKDLGSLQTGTGPTAITLQTATTNGQSNVGMIIALVSTLILTFSTYYVVQNRRQAVPVSFLK